MRGKEKKTVLVMASFVTCLSCLAGCGAAGKAGQETGTNTVLEMENVGEEAETSEKEAGESASEFTYLEECQIKDTLDDGKEYGVYAPKGGLNEEGLFYYNAHGITFSASVYRNSSEEDWLAYLARKAEQTADFWKEDLGYSDVKVGEALKKGDDCYIILTAKGKDSLDTPYHEARLLYMSVKDAGIGVFIDMEVRENVQDEETAALVGEVARCYDIDLDGFVIEDGTWAEQSAQDAADLRDVYEPEEGETVLEQVEGYQHLGKLTLKLDDEGEVTYPVLAPMGWTTETEEDKVSAMLHGVYVQIEGSYVDDGVDMQEMLQEEADQQVKLRNDPDLHSRNGQASEVMPLPGQETGYFYTLSYEMQNYGSEEYYKSAEVTWLVEVGEKYVVAFRISLLSMDYDNNTNSLIKELETAYGFDLSEWYAEE